MPVYICRWPNGDFSIVSAVNKQRAIELLDEVGNAEGSPSYGEATEGKIMEWGYPLLDHAWGEIASGRLEEDRRANAIQEAVAAERARVVHAAKEPETELGKRIKGLTDAPAGTINRIVKDQARR